MPVGPETSTEATQTSPQPEIHPVMSFFKTLVNKPGPKTEEEAKSDVEDKKKKENGGLRKSSSKKEKGKAATLQTPEKEMRAQKKAESSKSSTLGRLFRPKSKKDEVQTGGDKITAAADDGKGAKESPARPRLFWRKSSAEPDSQSAKADSGAKASPVTEGKSQQGKKPDEGKNSKPKIMMFFKQLTLDITDGVEVGKSEKTVVTAVVEPPPAPPLQKTKENAKEKKASSEKLTKQESRESTEAAASSQAQVIEAAPVLNGAESSKEGQMKRVEKRQSLGSFFKAIGPKRLCDAEVQTDPVSILPAEKAK